MKTKYKILIALTLLVVFGLGVAAGVLGERYVVHKKYRRPAVERTHVPSLDAWSKELQLTPDQQAKIREIFKKNEERMKAYWSEGTNKLREIRKILKEEIDSLLTPEQKKKMEEIIRAHEERRRNESDRKSANRNDTRERREPIRQPPDGER
jgi:Spy/CpxP family protein refolding chaperone